MTPEKWAEIEAAAEARAGGRMMRVRWFRGMALDEARTAAARAAACIGGEGYVYPPRAARLPEAAFDWPVYRAALGIGEVR